MNKIALIVSYFLPKSVKYYAMLDWMDDLSCDDLTIECPEYTLRVEKVTK
jgi:hypothetical protein